jgi:type II secretory pathway pseudopilin PulG
MRRHPPSARAAFTLIELIVIVGIIVLLAGVLLPSLRETKRRAQRIDCVGNLKQVGLSFRLWSLDSSDQYPMARSTNYGGTLEVGEDVWRTFLVMSNELGTPSVLFWFLDVCNG